MPETTFKVRIVSIRIAKRRLLSQLSPHYDAYDSFCGEGYEGESLIEVEPIRGQWGEGPLRWVKLTLETSPLRKGGRHSATAELSPEQVKELIAALLQCAQ